MATPYGGYQPEAPRPGIAPLRPLRAGEILHGALSAFRHNPAVALGLPLLILLLASLLGLGLGHLLTAPIDGWFSGVNRDLAAQFGTEYLSPEVTWNAANGIGTGIASGLISMLATPIIGGILAISISRSLLGDRISPESAWSRLRSRIPALIGWTILNALITIAAVIAPLLIITALAIAVGQVSVGGAVALGLLLGAAWVAFMLWISTRLLLVAPTIALEGRPLGESIRRGWGLTRGSFWRLLGIYLLSMLLISVLTSLITAPIGVVTGLGAMNWGTNAAGAATAATGLGTTIASLISTWISTILTSSILAFLYLDTRMRREGLDATLRSSIPQQVVTTNYYGG